MARQPAAQAGLDLAERQVDLVVHRDDAVQVDAQGPARGAHRAAGLVHVGLRAAARPRAGRRARCGRRRTGPRTASSAWPGPSARPPARPRRSRRCGACARSGRPGCPGRRPASRPAPPPPRRREEAHGLAPTRRRRSRPRRRSPSPASPSAPPRPRRPRPRSARRPRRQLGLLLDLLGLLDLGRHHDAWRSRSPRRRPGTRRPAAAGRPRGCSVSPMSMCETSTTIVPGMSVGRASMFSSRVDLVEHAALLDAGRLLDALELDRHGGLDLLVEADLEEVDVHHLVADGVVLAVLEDRGHRLLPPPIFTSNSAAPSAEQVAQLQRADLERDGIWVRWRRRARRARSPSRRRRRASRDPRSERSSTASEEVGRRP